MAVRMTGMISGLDTETLIKGMLDAQKLKNKKVSDKSTTLDWKQEKLKELNTKLYKLYSEDLTKLRLQGNYSAKKVTSSNDSLVEVKAGSTAPTGTVDLTIGKTATSQSVISGVLGSNVTTSTKLKDIDSSMFGENKPGSTIVITNGSKEKTLTITETTTINDFITACKSVDLNANYDTTQKRLFISSKNSGVENQFSIREYNSAASSSLSELKTAVGYSTLNAVDKTSVLNAFDVLRNSSDVTKKDEAAKLLLDLATVKTKSEVSTKARIDAISDVKKQIANVLISTKNDVDSAAYQASEEYDVIRGELIKELGYNENELYDVQKANLLEKGLERYKQNLVVYDAIKSSITVPDDLAVPDEFEVPEGFVVPEGQTEEEAIKLLYIEQYKNEKAEELYNKYSPTSKANYFTNLVNKEYNSEVVDDLTGKTKADAYQSQVETEYNNYVTAREGTEISKLEASFSTMLNNYVSGSSTATDMLSLLKLQEVTGEEVINTSSNGMNVVKAQNAELTYNGVSMISSSNTVTVNGFTITIKGQPAAGEKITLNSSNDVQGTYDMIKNFVTNYNSILKELNTLYYADSSRGYDPLSDDERESMTDDQIAKWETKIKDSVLRRDSNVGSLISAMKNSLMTPVTASNGKSYSLSSFGIGTSSDYTEKGLLHINGDADDATFSALTNKLMAALESDPDTVAEVMSKTIKNLYDAVDTKIKAIPNVRSTFTFYNDKLMTKQQTEYKKKIATLETKLTALETKYYKQFAAMETAMSKLQSQTSALSGMLGTSSN